MHNADFLLDGISENGIIQLESKAEIGMKKKDVTIHDVAAAAGVSTGTVHRALYGKSGVSAAVRQEILRLSEEMN